MSETTAFILSLSSAIPAIAALIKWKQVSKMYYPFIILMVVSLLSELIVGIAKLKFNSPQITPPVYNIYFATEYFLSLLLYKNFQLFSFKIFIVMAISGVLFLAVDFIFLQQGGSVDVLWLTIPLYAEVLMSLITFFPAIKLLSLQVFNKTPFITNPKNFIAIAFIMLKSYTILLFTFMLLKISIVPEILSYGIFQLINPLCYLIFTWAILWIPGKKKY